MEPIPDHACGVKDLDRCNCGRRIAVFQKDYGDIEQTVIAFFG
jgi:hypothetical protein